MNLQFNGKTNDLIFVEEEFVFPSMSKKVQYHPSEHASRRRRKRSIREPFSFSIPLIIKNNRNQLSRDEVNALVSQFLFSNGPKTMKVKNSNWYMIGEFMGPYELPTRINVFMVIDVEFASEYSCKFYDGEKVQTASKTTTINTKTQIPTTPLIELTGLTGSDVQISNSKADGSFKRIRLTGALPAGITIDPQNETIFTTSTGTERLDLLRIDSNFEDFTLEDGDVITLTNAGTSAAAKLTYKELML